jgi:hypothetical protein
MFSTNHHHILTLSPEPAGSEFPLPFKVADKNFADVRTTNLFVIITTYGGTELRL